MNVPNHDDDGRLAPLGSGESAAESQRILHDLLEGLWEQRKGMVVERLKLLEDVVLNLDDASTRPSRELGIDAAHKLAGILGTFGLPRGTDLAREVELAMSQDRALDTVEVQHLQAVVRDLGSLVAQRTLPTSR